MKNLVTLCNCAYIFHWSNSTYSWSKKDYERKREFNKRLYKLYDIKEDDKRTFEYVMRDGKVYVTIDGLEICINEKMMYHIIGEYDRKDIVNERTFKNPDMFESKKWHKFGRGWLHHNKFQSLTIDMFDDDLLHYRLTFKNDRLDFIVSCGKLYLVSDKYVETDQKGICDKLSASSDRARKDITELLNYLWNSY